MSPAVKPLDLDETNKARAQAKKESYPIKVLIGFDQFVNVIAGGHPGETISARSARAATQGKLWGKAMSGFLNLFQKNHGARAQAGDLERAETVEYLQVTSGNVKDVD